MDPCYVIKMATGDETSLKAFVFKKITKYRLLFPFLKENQVVAKLKRMWQNERVSQRVPKVTEKEARGQGDGGEKAKADKPRKSRARSPQQEYILKHTLVKVSPKRPATCPLSELTPNTPFRGHHPAKGSTAPSLDGSCDVSVDESIAESGVQSCDNSGWSCDHLGIEAGSGGEPFEGSESAYGMTLQCDSTKMPNFVEEAAVGRESDSVGAIYEADVALSPVASHSCEDLPPPHCPEGTPPPLSLHEGDQLQSHQGSRPCRRSRVCRDWRRGDTDTPPLGDGGGMTLPHGEGDLVAAITHADDCVLVKGDWNGGCNGTVGNLQDATEVEGDRDGQLCDKDSKVPSLNNVVCDMFVPLLPPEGQMADGSAPHRRVFRSAVLEGESNFSAMFANNSDIFL